MFKSYLVESILILIGLGLYSVFPFFQFYFLGWDNYGITETSYLTENGLYYLAIVYLILLPFVLSSYQKIGRIPKSMIVFNKILKGEFDKEFWFCIRIFLLKYLFIPLMFLGTIYYGEVVLNTINSISDLNVQVWKWTNWINDYIFPVFIYLIMTLVLIVYTFGYCVESDLLGNRIKSVDSSLVGWIVTIICYVPIYPLVFYFIPMGAQDFAFYKNFEITAIIRVILMMIIFVKAWSIFTLGTRSSNLTNRGIVTKGPYRWVRHPHYLTKLMVWWIGVIPSLVSNYWLIGGMIFWTTIYVLRALTEEEHLKNDLDYREYMSQVKWKFIPRIY